LSLPRILGQHFPQFAYFLNHYRKQVNKHKDKKSDKNKIECKYRKASFDSFAFQKTDRPVGNISYKRTQQKSKQNFSNQVKKVKAEYGQDKNQEISYPAAAHAVRHIQAFRAALHISRPTKPASSNVRLIFGPILSTADDLDQNKLLPRDPTNMPMSIDLKNLKTSPPRCSVRLS